MSSTRGFTLIEVVMASVIMLVGIIGSVTVLITGSRMLESSRQQTVASQILRSETERLRLTDWSTMQQLWSAQQAYAASHPANPTPPIDLTTRYPVASYPSFATVLTNFQFRCTQLIEKDVDGKTDYNRVTFTVTWVDHRGDSHTRSSAAYVAKNGLYVSYQR
jgi:prepilin-type N-terminal cleavage/methylation domain-containing protein